MVDDFCAFEVVFHLRIEIIVLFRVLVCFFFFSVVAEWRGDVSPLSARYLVTFL